VLARVGVSACISATDQSESARDVQKSFGAQRQLHGVGQLSEVVPFLLLEQRCGMPAQRCYVGLIAVGVQEQTEDVLVPPLLRNRLTFNYIPFS